MKTKSIITAAIIFALCTPSFAYKDNIHRTATGEAVKASSFTAYLTGYLGLESGAVFSNGWFDKMTTTDWIKTGGVKEDNFPRFLNHFFDPVTEKGIFFLVQQNSSKVWAKDLGSNDWDWASAREYFHTALTSADRHVRETRLADTFRAVGQVMHLVEDLASPAHVRNDVHMPTIWDKDFYEEYTDNKYNKRDENGNSFIIFTGYPPVDLPTFSNLDTFWKNGGKGLAEFTNKNFLSRDTNIDDNAYTSPVPIGEWLAEETPDPDKPPVYVRYQQGYATDDYRPEMSAPISKLASFSYFDFEMKKLYPDKAVYTLNNSVHREYAQFLVPRAVGYAAGLLNYFFRGKLTLTSSPADITFRSINVTASNNTAGETMGPGVVSLVVRYKALAETEIAGGKYKLHNPPAEYSYKVITLPGTIDLSTPKTLTFDFPNEPLPMNFSEMTMQLVYRGILGNEADAVAVSEPKVIDGIYGNLAVYLPESGVYAKTPDNGDYASFRELRVNVATDISEGLLSGGSFMLELEYRTALGNQFEVDALDTEPSDAAAYIFKTGVVGSISSLPPGAAAELVFDLSALPLSIQSTDLEVNIVYVDANGKKVAAGVRDISEPNPVDVFNSTDYSCLNGQWYRHDDPAAMAIVDSNGDGIADRFDIYPHTISNISFLAGAAGTGTLDATAASTLTASGPLPTGEKLRLGYILTDYSNRYAYSALRTGPAGDPWPPLVSNNSYTGTGFRNDDVTWSNMFSFRNKLLWWGTGAVSVNGTSDSSCTWEALQLKLGL